MNTNIKSGRTWIYYLITFILFIVLTIGAYLFIKRIFGGNIDIHHLLYFKSVSFAILVFAVFAIYIIADSWRLYYILRAMRQGLPFFYIVKLTFISIFVSNITPLAAGGGFMQLYLLHKKGVPIATATAITGLRTFLAILFFTITFPLAVILLPGSREFLFSNQNSIYFGVVVITYILFLVFIVQVFKHQETVIRMITKLAKKILIRFRVSGCEEKLARIERILHRFFADVDKFLFKKKKEFLIAMMITSLYLCAFFMIPIVLMYNYTSDIPFFDAFVNQIIVIFLTYFLALLRGAAGIAELVFVFFNSQFISGGQYAKPDIYVAFCDHIFRHDPGGNHCCGRIR